MGAKAWNVKLVVDSPDLRDFLDRNIEVWNKGCREICLELLALRRGEYGDAGKAAWDYIKGGTQRYHLIYWLAEQPKPTSNSEDVQLKLKLASDFVAVNGEPSVRLRQAKAMLGALWKQAIKSSIERVKSYEAKLTAWNEDHQQWLAERAEWESRHGDYLELRPVVEAFQRSAGATRGGRIRWHRWLEFLSSTREIITWRDAGAQFEPLTEDDEELIRKAGRKAQRKRTELVFEKNPDLALFDRVHGEYERRFIRSYAKRRHPDGFRLRPTFTLPSLPNRPEWPRFQRTENWRSLNLESRTVELRLLNVHGKNEWVCCKFVPDPRIERVHRLQEPEKVDRTKFEFSAPSRNGFATLLQPQGLKLIKRPSGFFLSITFDVQPPPARLSVEQSKVSKYSHGWTLTKLREAIGDSSIITCAVDLANRHVGAISVARDGDILVRRIINNRFSLPGSDAVINIPALSAIAEVQRQLRNARRKSGKMSPAKSSCRRLQEHYRNLQNDRFKKASAAMCQFAAHYGADVLIFEDLKRLVPDKANERGINRSLSSWNRGNVVSFAQQIAEDYGLRVVTVPAYHTSRICARCNGVGIRFDQGKRRPFRKPRRDFQASSEDRRSAKAATLGHWFFCPNCGHRIHADLNASENLHRVFLGTFPKAKRDGDFLVLDGERINLREVKTRAEQQLAGASFGKMPF